MNYRNPIIAALLSCGLAAITYTATAQDMDVDQADTIDFQSFHKDKKEAIKVWDKKSNTTTKAYQDTPADGSSGAANNAAAPTATSTNSTATGAKPPLASGAAAPANSADASGNAVAAAAEATKGKRFEIRERYTLTRSAKTPYSAFYVIEPLYKQSAQLCAHGWKKLNERSEPIEQDFYLYYEIECL